jgi:hypothetical protein
MRALASRVVSLTGLALVFRVTPACPQAYWEPPPMPKGPSMDTPTINEDWLTSFRLGPELIVLERDQLRRA